MKVEVDMEVEDCEWPFENRTVMQSRALKTEQKRTKSKRRYWPRGAEKHVKTADNEEA